MPSEPILAVVGAGAMGGQIAYQAALHGYDVRLISRSEDRLRTASTASSALLRRRVEKGTLDGAECEAALARVSLGSGFSAVSGAETIIESVAEDRDIKCEVYARICAHADDTAIIGTNSSTLPCSLLATAVTQPERFLNIHFFNPALLMALVEVVPGPHTAEATTVRAMDFARAIGKTPVRLVREEYGFIANRILFIAIQEAMRLVQGGYASIEDCDLAVRNALVADGTVPALRSGRTRRGRGHPRRGLSPDRRSALGAGRAAARPGRARQARQQDRRGIHNFGAVNARALTRCRRGVISE